MISREQFIKQGMLSAGSLSLLSFVEPAERELLIAQLERVNALPPAATAADEDFWGLIRLQYSVNPNLINLNNGGVSPQPRPVQEAHIFNYHWCNEGPSYYMWRQLDQGREPLREKLAALAGCDKEEIAINRNSTEGLNTIIFGLNLKAGDEVVLSKYDYPNMMNAWRQREKRDGIKLNWIDLPLPMDNEEAIVAHYKNAITPKTKVVHITHVINWTGQIVPARKIADVAKAAGCEVIVDGAHSFAHLNFKISDLNCDYFATSLHKWLCAPFGSGLMYVRKDKIKNVWALLSAPEPDGTDIRKFESIGTRSFASEMAISNAIDFHLMIGPERKEARLRYLKNYWTDKVKGLPKVKFNTSLLPQFSAALCNFSIEGKKPEVIEGYLLDKKKVHTVAINYEKIQGVRVTPHVYTSLADLDKLVAGIKELAA